MKAKRIDLTKILAYIFLIFMVVIWLSPIAFTFVTSFKTDAEIATVGYKFLPIEWTVQNYIGVIQNTQNAPLFRWFSNSIIISGTNTLLILIVASTSAYAYARLQFKGREAIFWVLMSTVMFPAIINLIPMYKICDVLNWIDNPLSLIIPTVGGVYNIFLIRQFIIGIPKEFDEAAFMDGANEWTIFTKIILPLSRPVLTIVALFAFTASWNDFLFPTVIINNVDKMTLTTGLRLLQDVYGSWFGRMFAGAILAMIPTFVIYAFSQKYFLEGLVLSSGVKG